jgi:hypothetical protein
MSNPWAPRWFWFAAYIALVVFLLIFGACSHAASNLERKQRAIQDCILSGGSARLGPGDTILCE